MIFWYKKVFNYLERSDWLIKKNILYIKISKAWTIFTETDNINFISVVDNIDSLKNQDEFEKSILISNLMNVWYKNDLKKRREVQRKLKGR